LEGISPFVEVFVGDGIWPFYVGARAVDDDGGSFVGFDGWHNVEPFAIAGTGANECLEPVIKVVAIAVWAAPNA
jgi:hypothetical protein